MKPLINWDEILKLVRSEKNVQNNEQELDEDKYDILQNQILTNILK